MDSEGSPRPSKIERIPFNPDRLSLSDTVDKIKHLEDGDLLFLSHSAVIVCEGNQKILCDLSPEGTLITNKKTGEAIDLYPTSLKDALMVDPKDKTRKLPPILSVLKPIQRLVTKEPRSQQAWSMFVDANGQPVSVGEIAAQIAPLINCVTVSHLDPDHFNVEFLDQAANANPFLQILVPLGFTREMAHYYNIPDVDRPSRRRPPLPERLISRMTALSPLNSQEDSASSFYGLEMHKNHMGNCHITSYEIPHASYDYNQALLIQESESDPGTLYIPDAALSPETLQLVRQLSKENKISKICISIAKIQPDPMYDIIPAELSKKLRDSSEEHTSHSAYLIPALIAVAGENVELYADHLGSFFRSDRNPEHFTYRLPTQDTEDAASWQKQFSSFIDVMVDDPEYAKLPSLTRSRDRQTARQSKDGLSKRKDFCQSIIQYLASNPIPLEVLNRFHLPGPNEVVKGVKSHVQN